MVLRRRFNYRWRLFAVMVVLMWLIVGVTMAYQYKREETIRADAVRHQMIRISNRILSSYEQNEDLNPFMYFIVKYLDNSDLGGLRVSVYDKDDVLLYNIGAQLDLDLQYGEQLTPESTEQNVDSRDVDNNMFYVLMRKSNDGQVRVLTAISQESIAASLQTDPEFWFIAAALMLTVVIIAYYSTGFLTRNVKTLTEFANRAMTDRKDGGDVSFSDLVFPQDELGDVSRQLVELYSAKSEALKRSEREHRIALYAVEEKSRIKRQLTNNINHELKTPIGVVRGYIDTILSSPDMDDETRNHFLVRAQKNVDRLCSLLNDVSTMTRLEEGPRNIPVAEINMHDLLYSIENDTMASNMTGGMKFSFDLPLDCRVRGNSSLLSGMLSNLIKNAALHSHGTEMGFRLVAENDKYYTFAFYDNGDGVAEEHLVHLFERFYRIDAGRSRKAGGTGLGLPIVKNTVEALGGTISVQNRAAGGLEIMFTLEKWRKKF